MRTLGKFGHLWPGLPGKRNIVIYFLAQAGGISLRSSYGPGLVSSTMLLLSCVHAGAQRGQLIPTVGRRP